MPKTQIEILPSAARLVSALRDVGYDFVGAVADLVDNSIAAKASRVDIDANFDSGDPWVSIADNGNGMSSAGIDESLRFGSKRRYEEEDLGKFGLGLKTASLSQARRVTVASRACGGKTVNVRVLDLDEMIDSDTWSIKTAPKSSLPSAIKSHLQNTGTTVLWSKLDRLLPYKVQNGERARRAFLDRLEQLDQHLGMVFHRFIEGGIDTPSGKRVSVYINGAKVKPWDPFARKEKHTKEMDPEEFDVIQGGIAGIVTLRPFILPNRHQFSSPMAHELSGRGRWNDSQGLWVYRSNRLIQDGGWRYLRANDEHTKYARAALDFSPDLDEVFGINIAKMRVNLPRSLKDSVREPIESLVRKAKQHYAIGGEQERRNNPLANTHQANSDGQRAKGKLAVQKRNGTIRSSLKKAAKTTKEVTALERILDELKRTDKEAYAALGHR